MKLVKEIRDGLANSSADLSGLLRKAKILSLTLDNPDFKAWTTNELNGYSTGSATSFLSSNLIASARTFFRAFRKFDCVVFVMDDLRPGLRCSKKHRAAHE